MWRLIIGILLIIHGLIHVGVATAPVPRQEEGGAFKFFMGEGRSWLWREIGISHPISWWVAVSLVAVATIGFVVAGIALLAGSGSWRVLAVGSSVISLALLALYWNRYLPVGVAVNVGILVALLWANWPQQEALGA